MPAWIAVAVAIILAVAVVVGVRTIAPRVPRRAFDAIVLVVFVGSVAIMLVESFS